MDLKDLEGKPLNELSISERRFIQNAYADYFDACGDLRRRAIGYAVLFGGVPVRHIGDIDICFRWLLIDQVAGERQGVGVGLNVGPFPVMNASTLHADERNVWKALKDYTDDEKRFVGPLGGNLGADGLRMPLFVSTKNSPTVGDRLHDCTTIMLFAGREIGFNASKLKGLHKLGDDMQVNTGGMVWSSAKGFETFGQMIPLRRFDFNLIKKMR